MNDRKVTDERTPRILVVDDEPDVQTLIRRRFRREIRDGTFEFDFALSGLEALNQIVDKGAFDIVLSDINMPEMDGLTLLGHLREYSDTMKTIIVSAYGDMDNIRTAMNRGAYDFLTKPINFDDLQRTIEKSLVDLKAFREVLDKLNVAETLRANMERELQIGRSIQNDFLPRFIPEVDGWKIEPYFRSAREVAGDFYDIFPIVGSDKLGLVVGDVCDKGIGAALFMTLFRSLLRAITKAHEFAPRVPLDPETILADPKLHIGLALGFANNYIAETHGHTSMFATVFFGLLDPETGELHYANAGHETPFIVAAGNAPVALEVTGPVVGLFHGAEYEVKRVELAPGETLVAYTDGVCDIEGEDGAALSEAGVRALLETVSSDDIASRLIAEIESHLNRARQRDDVTILAVTRQ